MALRLFRTSRVQNVPKHKTYLYLIKEHYTMVLDAKRLYSILDCSRILNKKYLKFYNY